MTAASGSLDSSRGKRHCKPTSLVWGLNAERFIEIHDFIEYGFHSRIRVIPAPSRPEIYIGRRIVQRNKDDVGIGCVDCY